MTSERGQALVETAVFFLAIAVLLGGFCGFTKWFVVRQRVLLAAKEGALLYSSGRFTRGEVESRVRSLLRKGSPALSGSGLRIDLRTREGRVAWALEIDECQVSYTPPRGWHTLLGVPAAVSETFAVKHAPKYWGPLQPWGGPAVAYGA